jgi:type IV secretory pathway VirB10-like protein
MTNSGDRESYNSETRQETYTDSYGNTHTNLTLSSETVNNNPNNVKSYRNGYVNGREIERNYQQANLAARDEENASRGLLLGILLTSVAGLIVGAFWYFNQPRETVVEETQPVVTPSPSKDLATPNFTPQPQQTTIIERTREVPVVIPQPQQQAPSITLPPSSPEINVTVPPQQPATSATQTTSPSKSSTDTPAAGNRSNTSENAVPQSPEESKSISNSDSSTTDDKDTDKSNPR